MKHPLRLNILAGFCAIALAGCVTMPLEPIAGPVNGPVAGPSGVVSITPARPVPPAATGREPIVIRDNKGGNVVRMIQQRNNLASSGRPVEIRGYCGSACTMLITMPNACLGPMATVGFHAPRIPNTTIIPPGVDDMMAQYYRNGILRRWNAEWKHSLKIQKISAAEYVRLDPQTRICNDRARRG